MSFWVQNRTHHKECIFLGFVEHHSIVAGITCKLWTDVLIGMGPLGYWTIPYSLVSDMQALIFLVQIVQNTTIGIVLKFIIAAVKRLKFGD